jgi:hypothetical protein
MYNFDGDKARGEVSNTKQAHFTLNILNSSTKENSICKIKN